MTEAAEDRPWTLLARGAGDWEGQETMPPAPWAPEGLDARGRLSARTIMGGKGLASDHTQRVEGEVTVTTHTVIRWDGEAEEFVMHFFGGPEAEPVELRGPRDGDRLVLEGEGAQGPMRQILVYAGDEMRAASEAPDGEGGWTTVFEGTYRRVEAEAGAPPPGHLGWLDLTVEDAEDVRDFYAAVVGWEPEPVSVGDWRDWNMTDARGTPVAGICHARGGNADLPPVWMAYLVVESLDASLEAARAGGGEVVLGPRSMGEARWAVIRDPAGAAAALYQPGSGA